MFFQSALPPHPHRDPPLWESHLSSFSDTRALDNTQILTQYVWGGPWESAFLTSSWGRGCVEAAGLPDHSLQSKFLVQLFSNLSMHQNVLGLAKTQISGACYKTFWFSRSWMEPGNLQLYKVPQWCWYCWSGTHTLRSTVLDYCRSPWLVFLCPLLCYFPTTRITLKFFKMIIFYILFLLTKLCNDLQWAI